ncbi:hypothetical protein BREU_2257 [Bifidobacterium reuteri DSM 23975]|uniref:Uncharacterized protein n=1 Tax=Bifidobacterium reuteri DSM 23975 TaxID=1437610 RepID=A0A087CNR9_9BIFI|nr:hypothetical protein BREU_2257 [Bifidobacterium reuteri DSM 23975]
MPAMRATSDDRKNCPGRTKNADTRYRDTKTCPCTPRRHSFPLQRQRQPSPYTTKAGFSATGTKTRPPHCPDTTQKHDSPLQRQTSHPHTAQQRRYRTVNIGKIGAAEVDFCATDADGEHHYQVSLTVVDEHTQVAQHRCTAQHHAQITVTRSNIAPPTERITQNATRAAYNGLHCAPQPPRKHQGCNAQYHP